MSFDMASIIKVDDLPSMGVFYNVVPFRAHPVNELNR